MPHTQYLMVYEWEYKSAVHTERKIYNRSVWVAEWETLESTVVEPEWG